MDWEAESRKRKREVLLLGLEDGYGLNMVVPRELDAEKCAPAAVELRFRFPDVTGAIKVDFLFLRCMTRIVVGVGSKHITGSFLEIIEKHGWQGLWAGNAVNMLRIIPTQAIELGTFECVKRTMISVQEKWKEHGSPKVPIGHINVDLSFLCISPVAVGGAAAGIVSTIICHPLEVLKVLDHDAKTDDL
ncbi:hypothetical protein BHE74_00050841 [Ensete ventricosum]|nr:hypothetical protein BHE74_00050841 [Ensete ventricosum]RZS21037.1 hypothetical protein BHM03_00053625 [Ensete ventricosum]